MATMLFGRKTEQAQLIALLGRVRDQHGGALVIDGEPGIGKSALLDYVAANAEGMRVLRARGVESEAELAFSGLFELIGSLREFEERLPGRYAAALRAAFGLEPPVDDNSFQVPAATLRLLSAVAEHAPVILLVDDAHWLDASSAEALAFTARRLEGEAVGALFATRDREGRRFVVPAAPELHLTGLDRAEALELLTRTARLPEEVAVALSDATRGNPLALLELPHLLSDEQRAGTEPLPDPLPVTEALQRAFANRIANLPKRTRHALVIAAAGASENVGLIGRACAERGVDLADLEPAEDAELVDVTAGRVVFRHPVLRAVVYHEAPVRDRRAAHRALAEAAAADHERDRKVWHLAAAALGPDEEVAAALAASGDASVARGGLMAAAAAYERAAALTPDPRGRVERLARAASAASFFEDLPRAIALFEQGTACAEVDELRMHMQFGHGVLLCLSDPESAIAAVREDVARLERTRAELAVPLAIVAAVAALSTGDPTLIEAEAQTLERLAKRLGEGDAGLAVARGLMLLAVGRVAAALPLLGRADELVEYFGELRWAASTYTDVAIYHLGLEGFFALGRFADARRRSGRRHKQFQTTDALLLPSCEGAYLARMDFETGHWASAVATYGDVLETCRRTGLVRFVWQASAILAEIAAARGKVEDCRRLAAEAAELTGEAWSAGLLAGGAEGLLELGRGRYVEAAASYEPMLSGLGPFTLWPQVADGLEAFVRAGLGAEVNAVLALFAEQANESRIAWACARAAHLSGLTAPEDSFPSCFEQALHWHAQAAQPFPQARTHFAYGERLRRQGRRTDARAHLRAALNTFEALGAVPWAERAAGELRATGERVARRRASRDRNLTSQELQVALAVAGGATNRQAAAELFLSPKTIEKHLGSVYAKLGVSSRSELARAFALERELHEPVGVAAEERVSANAGEGA